MLNISSESIPLVQFHCLSKMILTYVFGNAPILSSNALFSPDPYQYLTFYMGIDPLRIWWQLCRLCSEKNPLLVYWIPKYTWLSGLSHLYYSVLSSHTNQGHVALITGFLQYILVPSNMLCPFLKEVTLLFWNILLV